VPDCIRALQAGRPIPVRRPEAVRPWQHVLEPLSGYLWLGARLWELVVQDRPGPSGAFNFGPEPEGHQRVSTLVEAVLRQWPGRWERTAAPDDPHENDCLRLSIDRAAHELGWRPVWDFSTAVERTVGWYQTLARGGSVRPAELTDADLAAYGQLAVKLGRTWAR
jgi:CDP-glucose 4,6-dehydratase